MSRSQDDLVARASDPNAELATLHELAQNYPGLRPYIAANPRTYPALLEWLAGLGDPAVNAALTSRGSAADAAARAAGTAVSAATSVAAAPTAQPTSGPTQALPATEPTAAFPATQATTSSTTSAASAERPGTQAYPGAVPAAQPPTQAVSVFTPERVAPATSPAPTQVAPASNTSALPPLAQPTALQPVGGQPAASVGGSDGSVFGVGVTESQAPSGPRRSTIVLGILAAIALVLVVAIVVWFFSSASSRPRASSPTAQSQQEQPAATQDTRDQESTPTTEASPTPSPSPTQSQNLRAPAPTDAVEMSSFSAPSGNIACTLGKNSVSCTINEHSFIPEDTSCSSDPTRPFTVTVTKDGQAQGSCGGTAAAGGDTLNYGSSAKNDSFACTSTESAISCWSQVSGQGFSLSRADALSTVR
nr:hypothetical protein [Actinomyces sp.]